MEKLWGGRFQKKTDNLVEEFTKSIHYDYKIGKYDLLGSLAHVEVLQKNGYLNAAEAEKLTGAMQKLLAVLEKPDFQPPREWEDIHTYIQNELQKMAGETALKLQTARSRNDQVVFAAKFYCKITVLKTKKEISLLKQSLAALAGKNSGLILPGFTHLQHAQPVYLKDYLGAYMNMLGRDNLRLDDLSARIKLTMGSGALSGTPLPAKDYYNLAEKFLNENSDLAAKLSIAPAENSLDTVSDRDFVIETLSALAIIAMHLSRLAEDLILWATKEFDFIEIDEAYCTGSSLMPQKKNPDVLELIRGYSGRINGHLVSVLTMMKGLPLTYNRDMQLDKEPLFDSLEIVFKEVRILTGLVATLKFNKDKIAQHLQDEALYATDLVYYLVDKKVPFRIAHEIVGKLSRYSMDNGIEIKNIPEDKLKSFCEKFVKDDIIKLFNPLVSVKSKRSIERK
ncbi:MAG: argininosuccinate lyase [Candidatus Omnitrophota bacterium]